MDSQVTLKMDMLLLGEDDGTPLQYSCLENPMHGGAWQATVHEVTKSWTRLRDFTSLAVSMRISSEAE